MLRFTSCVFEVKNNSMVRGLYAFGGTKMRLRGDRVIKVFINVIGFPSVVTVFVIQK